MQNVPVRRGYAQLLAMALGALPLQFMDAMRHIRAERRWQPNAAGSRTGRSAAAASVLVSAKRTSARRATGAATKSPAPAVARTVTNPIPTPSAAVSAQRIP